MDKNSKQTERRPTSFCVGILMRYQFYCFKFCDWPKEYVKHFTECLRYYHNPSENVKIFSGLEKMGPAGVFF